MRDGLAWRIVAAASIVGGLSAIAALPLSVYPVTDALMRVWPRGSSWEAQFLGIAPAVSTVVHLVVGFGGIGLGWGALRRQVSDGFGMLVLGHFALVGAVLLYTGLLGWLATGLLMTAGVAANRLHQASADHLISSLSIAKRT